MRYAITFTNDKTIEVECDNVLYTPSHMEFQREGESMSAGGIELSAVRMEEVMIVPWANVLHAERV